MEKETTDPQYFGPCLITETSLKNLQPSLEKWVPPNGWEGPNTKPKGWDPRITYRGLTTEMLESLTDDFLMFEEEAEDAGDKNLMTLANLPLLLRTMGRNDPRRNAACSARCAAKSVARASDGVTVLRLAQFLEVMDEEQRQDAIEAAQADADR